MTTLNAKIRQLADSFAASIVAAIRSASLEEILAEGHAAPVRRGPGRPPKVASAPSAPSAKPAKAKAKAKAKPGKKGRLPRRSPADLERVIGLIVGKLGEHKAGLRSEQLQAALKLDKREISGPLAQALAAKKITKKGEKRATTYFAK